MRLSIIIPIYNVEKYIERCINSIFEQNLVSEDYEVLLIDDETPDQSGEIAKKIAESRDNYHYIFQKNKGLGGARNTGILHAKGNYILFLDSDDWLDRNSIIELLNEVHQRDLDILIFNMKNVSSNGNITEQKCDIIPLQVFTGQDFIINNELYILPCATLYRRDILIKNNIFFREGIFHEDVDFYLKTILNAQKVMYIPNKKIYNYYKNEQSITHNYDDKRIRDYGLAILSIFEILDGQTNKQVADKIRYLLEKFIYHWIGMLYSYPIKFQIIREVLELMKKKKLYPFQFHQIKLSPKDDARLWCFNNLCSYSIFFKYRRYITIIYMITSKL